MKKQTDEKKAEEKPLPAEGKKPRATTKRRKEYLQEAKKHAVDNEIEIVQSSQCGCYFCRHVFSARDVQDWLDDENGVSALCPECGMDAVIGDASGYPIDKAFMKEMNIAFYGEEFMKVHPEAARTYIERFLQGKIVSKPKSESLYLYYLTILLDEEKDPNAAYALGRHYLYGGDFGKPDYEKALYYFKNPVLSVDSGALNGIGEILLEQMESPDSLKEAYECFAKSAGLGSIEACFHLSDCYMKGLGVKTDKKLAFQMLYMACPEMYHRFAISQSDWASFPEFAYRYAECFAEGKGTEKDTEMALKYYILADLAEKQRKIVYHYSIEKTLSKISTGLFKLANRFNLRKNPTVFDSDSFEDSYNDFSINPGRKSISILNFDPDRHELSFSLGFSNPTLFFDLGNLNCGFLLGNTQWTFENVALVKGSEEANFYTIEGNYEEGFRFVDEDENGERSIVCEIHFRNDQGLPKENGN